LVNHNVVALAELISGGADHVEGDPPPPFEPDVPDPPVPEQPDDVIDLMVLYTAVARQQAEPLGGHFVPLVPLITFEICLAVVETNLALDDSLMVTEIQLVDIAQAFFGEDPADPFRVAGQLEAQFLDGSSVTATRRRAVLADLVSVWVSEMDPGFCGVGAYPRRYRPARGRSVVKRSCIPNHTMTHEIGHNLGAKHDPAAYSGAPSGSRYAYISRGPFVPMSGNLAWEDRDVMASSLTCSGSCPRLPMFSNPLKIHKFAPFGTVATHDATGYIDANNGVVDEYSSWLP